MRIGSLFSGYGGLDLAAAELFDASVVWHAEIAPAACRVLDARFPSVPNLGDVSGVDWSRVEPVDVLTGGFPCQDVSHAGLRAGVRQGTRSGLWFEMARAIDALRPQIVVIENVSGLLSADAACDVEPCPWCLGDEPSGHMRALGAVLADLAEIGFDAEWASVRASDCGAAHRRERVFIVAAPAGNPARGWAWQPFASGSGTGRPEGAAGSADSDAVALLPTPAVNDMGAGKSVEDWDAWTDAMRAKHGNGNGHGKQTNGRGVRDSPPGVVPLLPTPKATNNENRQNLDRYGVNLGQALGVTPLMPTPAARDHKGRSLESRLGGDALPDVRDFGPYAPAIARWEAVLGRPAPSPTEPGKDGRPRLSPRFVEFMMGLPDGWVTNTGIPRNAQLKALGNGVVPQQAALALSILLPRLVS